MPWPKYNFAKENLYEILGGNNYGKMSPSAFIPFCELGGNMSLVGEKIDNFSVPVCNIFQAKIRYHQLCYEVNLNKYTNQDHIEEDLNKGLIILLDYNEDRQVKSEELDDTLGLGLFDRRILAQNKEYPHANIYINTISKY